MLTILCARLYDPVGVVEIQAEEGSTFPASSRRVNRVATLDGGSVFNDGGFSQSDRAIELTWQQSSQATHEAVERLLQMHQQLVVSTRGGVYLVVAESYTPAAGQARIRLLVVQKLSP